MHRDGFKSICAYVLSLRDGLKVITKNIKLARLIEFFLLIAMRSSISAFMFLARRDGLEAITKNTELAKITLCIFLVHRDGFKSICAYF